MAANLAVAHDLKTRRGNVAKSTLKLGSASATIAGDYNLSGKAATVNATVNGPKMPVSELLTFLPVFGMELPTGAKLEGGTLSVDATSTGPMDALSTSGSVKIEGAKKVGERYMGFVGLRDPHIVRNVDAAMFPLPLAFPHFGGGKLKIVAVTSSMRHPAIPLVSTMAEAAISGFSAEGGFGLFTTKGVPAKTLEILRRAADSVVAEGSWKRLLARYS